MGNPKKDSKLQRDKRREELITVRFKCREIGYFSDCLNKACCLSCINFNNFKDFKIFAEPPFKTAKPRTKVNGKIL